MATSNILSVGIFRTWTRHHGSGANHLTSVGGYGRFRKKKISRRLILIRKKILQGNNFGKKYPALKKISRMADNAGKKILHR